MRMSRQLLPALFAIPLALAGAGAGAVPISWADWTDASSGQVSGSLLVGSTSVAVTYTGPYHFARTGGGGANYWSEGSPPPYTGSSLVDNAPPATDLIGLNAGGTKTITFSQAVQDPLIALVSWNGNAVDFGVPIEILSYGRGYWGSGTPVLNGSGTGFLGSGEVHGVIRLPGAFTSITFTDTTENWHGFTVGVVGLATVPEPATAGLLAAGLLLAGMARRRGRRT